MTLRYDATEVKLFLGYNLIKHFLLGTETDSTEFITASYTDSSSEDSDCIAFFQDLLSGDELHPEDIVLQHTGCEKEARHLSLGMIDGENPTEPNGKATMAELQQRPPNTITILPFLKNLSALVVKNLYIRLHSI